MSATSHESHSLTFQDYLHHHLTQWNSLGLEDQKSFWSFNIDSIIVSFLIAALLSFFLYKQAQKATSGVPNKFQVVVEMFVSWANDTVKSFINGGASFFGPLAGVTFLYIFAMNVIDFIPVDWIPAIAATISGNEHALFRPLPTADANVTFGIDLGVFIIIIASGIKSKGFRYYENFAFHPLPGIFSIPINLFLEVVGLFAEFLSLSLRLFGNMFAGEVIFVLIASLYGIGILGFVFALPIYFAWAILHLLVVTLQAYIFMMLAIVYISKSWNKAEH